MSLPQLPLLQRVHNILLTLVRFFTTPLRVIFLQTGMK